MSDREPTGESSRAARAASAGRTFHQSQIENLIRETRRMLAGRAYAEVIDKLEIHRPAEWAGVNEPQARLLRILSQAYLGAGEVSVARECLEHLRAIQRERPLLGRTDHAGVLSDLQKCYQALNLPDQARDCQEEAKRVLRSGD